MNWEDRGSLALRFEILPQLVRQIPILLIVVIVVFDLMFAQSENWLNQAS